MSNWRKHKKSTFQIKSICQKIERGRTGKYSMFDVWIPIRDVEAEIKRLKKRLRECNIEPQKEDSED